MEDYQYAGFEMRQVVDIDISRIVTEFRAQVLVDNHGQRFAASFPEFVTRSICHSFNCCPASAFRIISRINWASP